jgi:putative transposase
LTPNRLKQQFRAPAPNRIWTGDLTYIRTGEGWLSLAVVLDVFSRRVVGWSMQATMDESLVTTAFRQAFQQRAPQAGLVFHSDRGAQYCSRRFQRMLRGVGAQASMSGSGNCYDNAVTESFFSSLKRELVHVTHFPTRESARRAIFRYIEEFYNLRRRHSTLAYLSPADYEHCLQRAVA